MSKVPTLSSFLFGFVLAPMVLGQALPMVQRPVEDLLPASSFACVRFGGLDEFVRAADGLKVAAVVKTFLSKVPAASFEARVGQHLDKAAGELRQHLEAVGLSPATVRNVLRRPMALGVGRLTLRGTGPSFALVVDCAEGHEDVLKVIELLFGMAAQHGLQSGEATIAGTKVRTLQTPGPELLFADNGGYCVLTNSRGYLQEIGAVAAGKQPSLAQASALGSARSRLPQPALSAVFLNTQPMMTAVEPFLPYEAAELSRAFGIGEFDGLFAGVSGTSGGCAEVLHLALHGSEKGLFKAAWSGSAKLDAAKWCGVDTVGFAAGSIDLPAAVDAFRGVLDLLPTRLAQQARRELGNDLQREFRHAGMSPEEAEQLLRAFGSNVAVAFSMEKGAVPRPSFLLFVEVKDPQRVGQFVEQVQALVAQKANVEWKTSDFNGDQIHSCSISVGAIGISPSFVLKDGMLVFSSDALRLKAALKQIGKPDESLFAQPDFTAACASTKGASAMVHLRLFRAVEMGWRSLESFVGPLMDSKRDVIGFGSEVLPEQEAMSAALGTSTFAVHVDDDGVGLQSVGNLGFGGLFAGLGRAVDEVLQRASGKVY